MGLDSRIFYIHTIHTIHALELSAELCHSQTIRGFYELL